MAAGAIGVRYIFLLCRRSHAPALLQLSGIGNPSVPLGITTLADLPTVCRNLQEQVSLCSVSAIKVIRALNSDSKRYRYFRFRPFVFYTTFL
jgi:hypothetical protein